jgi:hypothetical protein
VLSPLSLVVELLLIESLYRNRVGLTDFDFLNSIGLGTLHHPLNLLTYASWFMVVERASTTSGDGVRTRIREK